VKFDELVRSKKASVSDLGLDVLSEELPCCVCNENTKWFDPFLEVSLCSEECQDAFFGPIEQDLTEIDENIDFLLDFNEI
jgi:hypothetical protein